jgi:hypothetical protein
VAKEDNVFPLYEFKVRALYKLIRRQLMDDTINSVQLKKDLFDSLRSLVWYYKDVDNSPIVGCQFEVIEEVAGKLIAKNIRGFLVLNSGSEIAFNNPILNECILSLFSKKIKKDSKLFFHRTTIESSGDDDVGKKRKK